LSTADNVDAEADTTILECMNLEKPRSFFLYAGAGSGKTRSLVEAIRLVCLQQGRRLSLSGKKIGVITYTNAACNEIKLRLEFDPRVEVSTIHAFAWSLIAGYDADSYVQGLSPFDTHQGVKGLEFPRVMVIVSDEEARGFMFAYDKLFGGKEKSKTDLENEAAGKETSVDRTRRLFYVTCSRAEEGLAVVYYAADPPAARAAFSRQGWFTTDEIEIFG